MSPAVRALRLVGATAALQSLAVTAFAGAAHEMSAAAAALARPGDSAVRVVASVQAFAWAGLALCCLWFAAAVLACARDLARHPARPLPRSVGSCLRPPLVRSLLLVLVGGCLATPPPVPVAGEGWSVLDGLPVPGLPLGERASDGPQRPRPLRDERVPRTVVVRSGDSLWSLTAGLLGPHAPDSAVARAWPALHRANRALIGPDPDLVLPGATLRVPVGLTAPHDQHRAGAAR